MGVFPLWEKGKQWAGGGVHGPAFASELQAESGTKPEISAFLSGLLPPELEILSSRNHRDGPSEQGR